MAQIVDVTVTSNLDEVIEAKDEAILKALIDIGQDAEAYAKMYAPVDTGNLRGSISNEVSESESAVYIGTNVEYAPYLEFGTGKFAEGGGGRQTPWRYQDEYGRWHTSSGIPAQPYLRPAIENHLQEYKETFEEHLKED